MSDKAAAERHLEFAKDNAAAFMELMNLAERRYNFMLMNLTIAYKLDRSLTFRDLGEATGINWQKIRRDLLKKDLLTYEDIADREYPSRYTPNLL